jgi:hypothetical protein
MDLGSACFALPGIRQQVAVRHLAADRSAVEIGSPACGDTQAITFGIPPHGIVVIEPRWRITHLGRDCR